MPVLARRTVTLLAALGAASAWILWASGRLDAGAERELPLTGAVEDREPPAIAAREGAGRAPASPEADPYREVLGDTDGRNRMNVDDLRAWKRIGWRNPLPTARDLAAAAEVAATDDLLAELREVIARHEEAIAPVRDKFTRGLSRAVGVKVERGEFTPVDTSDGLEPDEYDGGWAVWTTRRGIAPDGGQGTASVHVYPGDDAQLDATWDDLQVAFDAFFWEAGETLKDY